MEKYNKTYNSICRVCLKQNEVESMVSLKETIRRNLVTYDKMLMKLARISIDYDNILPTKICQTCKEMVERIHTFKLMCKNNDRKLRKFVNLAQNDTEKCKEMICEYTWFCHYFPKKDNDTRNSPSSYSSCRSRRIVKSSNFSPILMKSESNLANYMNDFDSEYNYYGDSISYENNHKEKSNDMNSVDLFLDSIENVINSKLKFESSVKTLKNHSDSAENIDLFLDSIENAVNMKIKYRSVKTKVKEKPKLPEQVFHCDICNRTLANRFTFSYHMQRHTKYRYICDQCGRGFPGKEPLNRHLIKNHDKGLSLLCDHCPFKCSKRFDLVEHIRIHTGERPFTCDKCGLTFRRKAIWTNHLIQHKEKTVCCSICQKKFHRQSELTSHLNSVHERMFLYLCSICNTSFAKGGTVRKHMLSKHGIPREKQGKITRVTKDSNSLLFMVNKSDNMALGFPGA